ncbi:MAG TPA: lipoprotein [Gammaproteobacteria bacterium]|jgi:predicted small lipoprotein YifL
MVCAARRRFLRTLLLSAAGVAVSGCGQKGPLYLPEEELKKKKEKYSNRGESSPAQA